MTTTATKSAGAPRVDWVDVAKGICIILVVMMHSTLGVEKAIDAPTQLHHFIEWARPFRMPDFFLISGLFLASRIDRPWRPYLDTKVVHFAYFYVLWLTIQFAFKAPSMVGELGPAGTLEAYLLSFIDPFGTLWFIYLLAVFFVVSKAAHNRVPKVAVWIVGALLHTLAPKTGWILIDEFTDRFVFFYTGYVLAPLVFTLADRIGRWPSRTIAAGLVAWAIANAAAVISGVAFMPVLDFFISYAGITAVIAFSVLIRRSAAGEVLAYCGRNSIAVYLAFTLFMAPTRLLLLKFAPGLAPELVALAATVTGVIGPLVMRRLVVDTPVSFLFVRPQIFRLVRSSGSKRAPTSQVAVTAGE